MRAGKVFSIIFVFSAVAILCGLAPGGEKRELSISLTREGKPLEWIRDKDTDEPWNAWCAWAYVPSKDRHRQAESFRCSGNEGVLSPVSLPMTVVVGRYSHPNTPPELSSEMSWTFTVAEMKEDKTVVKLDFLKPVHGRVVGADGKPAAYVNALVELEELFYSLPEGIENLKNTHWLKTDANGQYEIDALLPGRYRIEVLNQIGGCAEEMLVIKRYYQSNGRNYLPGKPVVFEAKYGMDTTLPDAPIVWCDLPVRVRISHGGNPVPNARVTTMFADTSGSLSCSPRSFRLSGTTDKTGTWQVDVPRARGKLTFLAVECDPIGESRWSGEIEIEGSEKNLEFECVIPSQLATLRITIRNFDKLPVTYGEHAVEWNVSVRSSPDKNKEGFYSVLQCRAAATIEIPNILPGRYQVDLMGWVVASPPHDATDEYWEERDKLFQELNDKYTTDVEISLEAGEERAVVLEVE